jgi:hypothetical protein
VKRRYALVVLILLVFGWLKLGYEEKLTEEHRAAFFKVAKLDLGLRQEIGQLAFLAALSGFRAPVADALWIQAHTAWENTEWGRMALLLDSVVTLQPRSTMFWDIAAWHMAWNASVAALNDPNQPREALRLKAQREYFDLGRDFLERGIRNNPDRYELYERLGFLLKDKYNDPCAAAKAFRKASEFDAAPAYLKRFAAYETARCPETEREGYEMLKELYLMGKQERMPTLLRLLSELQEKFDVPKHQRVYNPPVNGPHP